MLRETSSCPGATKEAISRYPMPEHLADRSKYAALTLYRRSRTSLRHNCQSVLQRKCAIALPRLGGTSRSEAEGFEYGLP